MYHAIIFLLTPPQVARHIAYPLRLTRPTRSVLRTGLRSGIGLALLGISVFCGDGSQAAPPSEPRKTQAVEAQAVEAQEPKLPPKTEAAPPGEDLAASQQPRVFANQRYRPRDDDDDDKGLCDLMLPAAEQAPEGGFPTVIIVHGGAWMSGDKWATQGYARVLADRGYATININYRLAPRHKFPSQVDDVREALVWACENANRFSLDLRRLGLFGYSAGGHLSLLVSLIGDESIETKLATSDWPHDDHRWRKLPAIHAVCVGGPPCDFRNLPPQNTGLAYFLGGSRSEKQRVYEAASPIVHISAADPPVHLIHGDQDSIVPIQNSLRFRDKAKAAGLVCELTTIAGQGHLMTFLNPQTSNAMVEFFDQNLAIP
ncbi:Carboxylesterase NlhH [Novipirellula galeiformis]|uniref:Carboxylesterase NlhH n=1 Tax=Novipirellula galeiformis TaxID=2528004 RepID=A0A5C6CAL6_9BACT|nr:alpha/beta hydrolase [Novipirellula galeiformis]TWU20434.1 Carboxylesterase NlhH [Novipirellula galeiformis]